MSIILVFATLALLAGTAALLMTTRDFTVGTTFRPVTAVAIYAGWACHAAAFVAAVVLDPYRLDVAPLPMALVGVVIAVAGVALFVLSVRLFHSFGHVTGTEVGGLVTSGAYRISRNPQYTGWVLLLVGVAVAARSALALALALSVVVAMRIWIPQEERHLEEEFGEEYLRYRREVPRFLRLKPRPQSAAGGE